MFEFRAERLEGKTFPDRNAYLHDRIGIKPGGTPVESHALCNAIARANRPFNSSTYSTALPGNFPWLTLVLGSGCATETMDNSDLTPIAPRTINSLIREAQLGGGKVPLGDDMEPIDLGGLAGAFAENLIKQRMSKPKTSAAPRKMSIANLVLATALLTRLYRRLAAESALPLDPRGNDSFLFTPQNRELKERYVDAVNEFLPRMWGDQLGAVKHVLERIDENLKKQPGYIERLDLQILTEYTWLAMTDHCANYYYGWSSLLAHVARADSIDRQAPHTSPPRPRFNPDEATFYINRRYEKATEASWLQRKTVQRSGRIGFFDAAANVLSKQAALRKNYPAESISLPPVASAFSTSFDIELEMSLARRNCGFVIVLPALIRHRASSEPGPSPSHRGELGAAEPVEIASLRWLGAVIAPSDAPNQGIELKQIREPDNWFMLSGERLHEGWRYANWPFVVHLAGCPLITLPKKNTPIYRVEPDDPDEPDEPRHLHKELGEISDIQPAILLDEYGAIQQHSTEMFGDRGKPYGLPDQLTSPADSGAPGQARFWLLMGVQMGDAAIRYGVASRLGTGGRKGAKMRKLPERAGLFVSSNVDPAARDLMQWYGVDVVRQHCGEFTKDLDHYAEHLELGNAKLWPSEFYPNEQCFLLRAKQDVRS